MRRPRFQFQFGLKTLFVLVTLAAVVTYSGHYAMLCKRVRDAAYQYQYAYESFHMGTATTDDALNASEKWWEAELRVPFADRFRVGSDRLERIEELERQAEYHLNMALFGGDGRSVAQHRYERLRDLRKQADEQLRQEPGR
jgi:hypothetical protein